jgi:hypothetical protein
MRVGLATLLLVFLGISAVVAQTSPPTSQPAWPPLPTTGFVSGRAATNQDVADGNAVFVLKVYGAAVGKPLDITVPQYAYLMSKGGNPVPVIVIQAETYRGLKLIGIRDLAGKTSAVREADLQLWGTTAPK